MRTAAQLTYTQRSLDPAGLRSSIGAAPMQEGQYYVVNRGANVPTSTPDRKEAFAFLRSGISLQPPRYLQP